MNQNDLQERGAQVDMTGDIYSRADSVCVWLGESNASTTKAMALLEKARLGQYLNWDISCEIPRFFKLPWFHRVWVLPEVWKARKLTVKCGKDEIPCEAIITMNAWMIKECGEEPYSIMPSIWTILSTVGNSEVKQKGQAAIRKDEKPCFRLLDLFLGSISMSATDPRDKVYALLGMCREIQDVASMPSALRADYTKTIGRNFADFTRWLIAEYDSLFILSLVHASANRAWKEPLGCSASMPQPMKLPLNHPSWALWYEGDGNWVKRTLGMSGLYQGAGHVLPILEHSDESGLNLSLEELRIGVV